MTKFEAALNPPAKKLRIDIVLLTEVTDMDERAAAERALRNPEVSEHGIVNGFAALGISISRAAISNWRRVNGIK